MIITEVKVLSEALWESTQTDLKFFSPIQLFIKKLSELSYLEPKNINEGILYINKVEEFFRKHRSTPGDNSFYIPHHLITCNDDSVIRIKSLLSQVKKLSSEELQIELATLTPKSQSKVTNTGKIFIGHGRSKIWARVKLFITDELGLEAITFEDESRTSETILNVLAEFLDEASYAILILTSEDEVASGKLRARQNVIHEAGLFQGRLGFDKVIILKQENIEEFSNLAGLQYIPFSSDNIEHTFYELQRKMKKMGLIK
jgi:predicted nucleotide-binding protein